MLQTPDREEIKPEWRARLEDPLSPATRGERKLLLLISTVSLLLVVLGLFPSRIEALGIVFESKDRAQMILLLAAVNGYALAGCFLYGWSDYHLLRRSYSASSSGYIDAVFARGKATLLESTNFFLRVIFDFLVPLCYGVYALWRLYTAYHANY